jgi:hypothetical protein
MADENNEFDADNVQPEAAEELTTPPTVTEGDLARMLPTKLSLLKMCGMPQSKRTQGSNR